VIERVLQLVLAAWAGSLWTICGVVAPSLFAVLPERQVAGQLAGYFFSVATWFGLGLGSIALALLLLRKPRSTATFVLLGVAASAPLLSELILRPIMDAARAAGDMARFGMLHGVSALLFGVACLSAAALVWRSVPVTGSSVR
jgi:pimeloyl-ACP methyl ester carboxylesterase